MKKTQATDQRHQFAITFRVHPCRQEMEDEDDFLSGKDPHELDIVWDEEE